jgi:hypothetical protein
MLAISFCYGWRLSRPQLGYNRVPKHYIRAYFRPSHSQSYPLAVASQRHAGLCSHYSCRAPFLELSRLVVFNSGKEKSCQGSFV